MENIKFACVNSFLFLKKKKHSKKFKFIAVEKSTEKHYETNQKRLV